MSGATVDNLRLAIDEHRAQLERNADRSVLLGSFSRVVDLQTALVLHLETEVAQLREARGPFEVLGAGAKR